MSKPQLPFLRTAYNYDRNAASDESGLDSSVDPVTGELTPSLTKQSFKDEVDINTIMRKFGVTGELPQGVRAPTYGDFSGVSDFQSAMNAIATANEAFDQMPAEWRARFHNDPQEFVEFCSDEANRAEAEKMGLIMPKAVAIIPPEPPEGKKETPKGVT